MDGQLESRGKRLRSNERREQILLELKLHPHVRVSEMAQRFGVSTETVRRDMDKLSKDGLIARAHGGATASRRYPGLDERSRNRMAERAAIGQRASTLVAPGDTVMIDSGSTTAQLARFLAYAGTPCTVITNSLTVAMTLGPNAAAEVILCPGDFLPAESAVVGTDTVEYLERYNVDRCLIGASGLDSGGISETVRGFAAIKRAMLASARAAHLLVDSGKFGQTGLAQVGRLDALDSVVVDTLPDTGLLQTLTTTDVEVIVAEK